MTNMRRTASSRLSNHLLNFRFTFVMQGILSMPLKPISWTSTFLNSVSLDATTCTALGEHRLVRLLSPVASSSLDTGNDGAGTAQGRFWGRGADVAPRTYHGADVGENWHPWVRFFTPGHGKSRMEGSVQDGDGKVGKKIKRPCMQPSLKCKTALNATRSALNATHKCTRGINHTRMVPIWENSYFSVRSNNRRRVTPIFGKNSEKSGWESHVYYCCI